MGEREKFDNLRILVVGGRPHSVQLLRQVFDILGIRRVQSAPETTAAIDLLRTHAFAAVFCDEHLGETDPEAFAHAARRTPGLYNPMVPIFLVSSGPRRREVEAARDTGFTDVLARPLSASTVLRKLKNALGNPRPFIAAGEFFGPDRRSVARKWLGSDRRKRQPRKVKVAMPSDPDLTQM